MSRAVRRYNPASFAKRLGRMRGLRLLLDKLLVGRRRIIGVAFLDLHGGDAFISIVGAFAGGIFVDELKQRFAHVIVLLVGEIDIGAQEIGVGGGRSLGEAGR